MDAERDVAPPQDPPADPRVAEAVRPLAVLADSPLDEHPAVLEAVHDRLREILGELGDPGRDARR